MELKHLIKADSQKIVKSTRNAVFIQEINGNIRKYCLYTPKPKPNSKPKAKVTKNAKQNEHVSNSMEMQLAVVNNTFNDEIHENGAAGSSQSQTSVSIRSLPECRVVLENLSKEKIGMEIAKIKSSGTGSNTTDVLIDIDALIEQFSGESWFGDVMSDSDIDALVEQFSGESWFGDVMSDPGIGALVESGEACFGDRIKIHSYESSMLSTELNGLLSIVSQPHQVLPAFDRNIEFSSTINYGNIHQIDPIFGSYGRGNISRIDIANLLLQLACNVEIVSTVDTFGMRQIEAVFRLSRGHIAQDAVCEFNIGRSEYVNMSVIGGLLLQFACNIEIVSTIRQTLVKIKWPLQQDSSHRAISTQTAFVPEDVGNVSIQMDGFFEMRQIEPNDENHEEEEAVKNEDSITYDENGYSASDEDTSCELVPTTISDDELDKKLYSLYHKH